MSSADDLYLLATATERLELATDDDARITAAAEVLRLVGSVPELAGRLAELRRTAAVALRRAGVRPARIAELAGVSRSAISQLLGPTDELEERRLARLTGGPQ